MTTTNTTEDVSLIPLHRIEELTTILNALNGDISQLKGDTESALELKADDESVVHKSGEESISDKKTFTSEIQSTTPNVLRMKYGNYGVIIRDDGRNFSILLTDKDDKDGNYNSLRPLSISLDDGALKTITPDDDDNSNRVATTEWVRKITVSQSSTFVFTQAVASTEWQIKHDLEKYPSVTVVDSAGTKVEGDVKYVDNNNLVISFSSAFTGKAYLN